MELIVQILAGERDSSPRPRPIDVVEPLLLILTAAVDVREEPRHLEL